MSSSTVGVTVIANGTSYVVQVASPITPRALVAAFLAANPSVVPPAGQRWSVTQGGVTLPNCTAVAVTGSSEFTLVAVPNNDWVWWLIGAAVLVWAFA